MNCETLCDLLEGERVMNAIFDKQHRRDAISDFLLQWGGYNHGQWQLKVSAKDNYAPSLARHTLRIQVNKRRLNE